MHSGTRQIGVNLSSMSPHSHVSIHVKTVTNLNIMNCNVDKRAGHMICGNAITLINTRICTKKHHRDISFRKTICRSDPSLRLGLLRGFLSVFFELAIFSTFS